jgi:hypothetical protein
VSKASDVSIGGVVTIGSVTSSALAVSTAGGVPQLSGGTSFAGLTVEGQSAYVDGAGVHLGTPGNPAGPAQESAVNAALTAAGMEVYFTDPHHITVGELDYYYAASVLFYWAPPRDPSHNSFTLSLGGSAVSMTASATDLFQLPVLPSGLGPTPIPAVSRAAHSGIAATSFIPAVATPAQFTRLALPTTTGSVAAAPPQLSQPGPARVASAAPQAGSLADTSLPGGLGVGWWLLVVLGAGLGAALLTRVPGLLASSAATSCLKGTPAKNHRRDPL